MAGSAAAATWPSSGFNSDAKWQSRRRLFGPLVVSTGMQKGRHAAAGGSYLAVLGRGEVGLARRVGQQQPDDAVRAQP